MNWSLKAICYWLLLSGCLLIGILFIGAFLLLWSMQINFALSLENVLGMGFGIIFLAMFFIFYENRIYFPLRKASAEKDSPAPVRANDYFCPIIIELKDNIHGLPVLHACGAPSSIRFRATQINPASQCREEDYERIFYNSMNGEIVPYDKSRSDHRGLYKHFLWIIDPARKSVLPKSYLEQYNIIKSETDGEKRAETLH